MAMSLDKVAKRNPKRKPKKTGPWSQRGLAKEGRSPKSRHTRDAHLSDDWSSLHEAPLFWVDISQEARLAALQEALFELERKATRLARVPREILRSARRALRSFLSR